MEFVKGKYYYCTEDIFYHGWMSSYCFIKGNYYRSQDEKTLIDEYGSPAYFPEDNKDIECFQISDDEVI